MSTIFYLIITNKSEMLVTGTGPYTIPSVTNAKTIKDMKTEDKDKIDAEFRQYVRANINDKIEIKGKITKCENEGKNIMVVVHAVKDGEIPQFQENGHLFKKTFQYKKEAGKETTEKEPLNLDAKSLELFTDADYKTKDSPLDKCISTALSKTTTTSSGIKLTDSSEEKKLYLTFFRPSLFVPPFFVDPVASLFAQQRYGIRSPYASPYSSPRYSPRHSPRFDSMPSRARLTPGDAPRVARSPRVHRRIDMEGGYYEKYVKYKGKYLALKKQGV
jgi:hypothetical protein